MSYNLVVWKWSADYDTTAKRRKAGVKYGDITAAFADEGSHPAMAEFDFTEFEAAIAAALGPEVVDGPYLLERYSCARVFNLPFSQVPVLVSKIGSIARNHGLTSAEG